ncbi:THAP domain-containing protein 1 isoform X2 [Dromiciops gliroides]|uniref:THAP domain-containing protein 1 isoform X2 n=1 Tax=Dromiciops gliroides TaxID=33562 RepID=UPI001CC5ACAF|nr:THAP domain-containing protein 1 isoform X2 [Dromiciops gliroides]
MVQSCSAYGCRNRYDKDKPVSFHKMMTFWSNKNSSRLLPLHLLFPKLMLLLDY